MHIAVQPSNDQNHGLHHLFHPLFGEWTELPSSKQQHRHQLSTNSIDINHLPSSKPPTIIKTIKPSINDQQIINSQQPTATTNARTNEHFVSETVTPNTASATRPRSLSLTLSPLHQTLGYPTSFRGLTSGPVRPICVRCINVRSIPHSL